MNRIREEFEKIPTYHIKSIHNNIGLYTIPEKNPEGVWCLRSEVERGYYSLFKSTEEEINNNYFEVGTLGTTPLYTKSKAKMKIVGKLITEEGLQEKLGYTECLYTPEELQKAIKQEREECALICEEEFEFDTGLDVADIIRNKE